MTHRQPTTLRYFSSVCLFLCGCTPMAGLRITPVPADQSLEERLVASEPGMLRPKIAIIDVSGLIMNAEESSLLGEGEQPVSLLTEKLHAAEGDDAVRAVVLRINSPGGTVTASDLMYSEVLRFKQRSGKPVVAMLMDVAASGAYYLACAADEIIACPTTVTGSIGVIMQTVELSGTLEKLGITADAITSGRHKDSGSPLRKMRPEERELFQQLVNGMYERFVSVVQSGRPKVPKERVRELADGRVYLADQAVTNGLVDHVGTMEDALAAAKSRAGLAGKPVKVILYSRPLGWRPTWYAHSASPDGRATVNLLNIQFPQTFTTTPRFLYLWSVAGAR